MGVVFIHFQVDIGAESVMYGLLSAIRPILECCYVVWHHGLTKTQVEQLEAVLRRAIRIIFEVTFNMPYQFAMACANISSLHACREDINKTFFRKILNNPHNPVQLTTTTPWCCYCRTTPISPPAPQSEDMYLQVPIIYTLWFTLFTTKCNDNSTKVTR